ncbi:flagellar basal body rod protein [Aciduricibacillus chroicocephali]|uniref:Flagellar basal body rod protein n=1 Tax=Aciduricibacillus chroicocephali TaxID=3054939 RepID=A0ABY9KX18_9BACI|nr:flagellar basal body rod protein [Bacillaceae bacterium 44XB]
MKKFLLFLAGLTALIVAFAMIGPMVLLGVSVWLLYIVFKQFMRSGSVIGKIAWLIIGLVILSMAVSHIYALIGLAAAYAVYYIYKQLRKPEPEIVKDPFTNFEKEWNELHHY